MIKQIDRYEIRRELGRGGMATVYLAFDPRFRRQVAIKVLPRQFTHDPRYLARFEQEAQMIATLEHPAIVPVYDFGEHDDAPYLVMRYLAGGNLRQRISGQPMSLEEIAPALDRLAPALDYAHEVGIIHRDLKPSNILFDHDGRPYMADFGIARLAEASQTITMIGTPAYMSPEQVESELQLDGRSDIYALGVMFYELLTGKPPYTAETPTGQMLMHITKPVPNILATNPELPPETQQVIDKAMAKDREERYQSAAELAAAANILLDTGEADAAEIAATATAPVILPRTPGDLEKQIESEPTGKVSGGSEPDESKNLDIEGASATESAAGLSVQAGTGGAAPPSVPPVDSDAKQGGIPGWVWWTSALALLVIVILGLRSILGGLGQAQLVETPDAPVAIAAELPTSTATLLPPETPAVTPSPTKSAAAAIEKKTTATLQPTETYTETPSPAETAVPALEREATAAPSRTSTAAPIVDPKVPPPDAQLGDSWTRPKDQMVMVYVPPPDSPFVLESGVDAPQYGYWIDKYEVSNAQYQLCVDNGACEPGFPSGDEQPYNVADYPVVSIFDEEAYSAWVGGALPTEGEWEYAAVGDSGMAYPWGNEASCEFANFRDCVGGPSAVDSYPEGASWVGALNMAGNVSESTADYPFDLGGSWCDSSFFVRAAYRSANDGGRACNLSVSKGFRLVVRPSSQ